MNLLHGLVIQIFAKKGIGNGPLAKFLNMQTGILENQMKVACKILKILKIMLKYTLLQMKNKKKLEDGMILFLPEENTE